MESELKDTDKREQNEKAEICTLLSCFDAVQYLVQHFQLEEPQMSHQRIDQNVCFQRRTNSLSLCGCVFFLLQGSHRSLKSSNDCEYYAHFQVQQSKTTKHSRFKQCRFRESRIGKSLNLMFMNVWEPCFQDKAILLFIIIIDPKGLQFVCVCVCVCVCVSSSITVLQSMKLGIDVNRHKEIIVKAISALLLLLLKHFKLNHVYQVKQTIHIQTHTHTHTSSPLLQARLITAFLSSYILLLLLLQSRLPPSSTYIHWYPCTSPLLLTSAPLHLIIQSSMPLLSSFHRPLPPPPQHSHLAIL